MPDHEYRVTLDLGPFDSPAEQEKLKQPKDGV